MVLSLVGWVPKGDVGKSRQLVNYLLLARGDAVQTKPVSLCLFGTVVELPILISPFIR